MPAITLLLLATCCNLLFTKRKMKSRTDRLMQAVSENEPVIQAVIARGFDQHEVHVCVRHFYTKNPSFVPLTETKLLQLVKERQERHKKHASDRHRMLPRSSAGWRKGGGGLDRQSTMSNMLAAASPAFTRRDRKGHTQEEIADLVEKVKNDPHDYFSAADRRLMLQVGHATDRTHAARRTPTLAAEPSQRLADPAPPQVLRFRKQHPKDEAPVLQGTKPAGGGAGHGAALDQRVTVAFQGSGGDTWMANHFQVTQANKHHIAEAVAQGYALPFVQEAMQEFYDL